MKIDRTIDSWITGDPVTVDVQDALGAAVDLMASHRIGAVLVTRQGKLTGIFTERDVLKLFASRQETPPEVALTHPVERYMTADPISAQKSDGYDTVYMKMKVHGVRHIPVLDGEQLTGIVSIRDLIHFYQNRLEDAFLDAQREIESLRELVKLSDDKKMAAIMEEIQRYRRLSLTDELTGLYNKRYFQARLIEEVTRAKRHGHQLALIFCDIDFFKSVNDNFGHQCGDEILRQTASILTGSLDDLNVVSRLRKSDIVARYGGEEFVVILPQTPEAGARVAAEKIRRVVEAYPFHCGEQTLRITMSFGIGELSEKVRDSDTLVRNADYAMYRAKERGRNRVECYP